MNRGLFFLSGVLLISILSSKLHSQSSPLTGGIEPTAARALVVVTPGANRPSSLGDDCLSADGRWLAFTSQASNLVTNDFNGLEDVFVHDLVSGATRLVSISPAGRSGNGRSSLPVISPNGRYVAFTSEASDLAHRDNRNAPKLLVRDLRNDVTLILSRGDKNAVDAFSLARQPFAPVFSPSSRYLAFGDRFATEPPASGWQSVTHSIFLYDLEAKPSLLNPAPVGMNPISKILLGDSYKAPLRFEKEEMLLCRNGLAIELFRLDRLAAKRFPVASSSSSPHAEVLDVSRQGTFQLFVFDRATLQYEPAHGPTAISALANQNSADKPTRRLSASEDGSRICFIAAHTRYVYVLDRRQGDRLRLVSASLNEGPLNEGRATLASISGDGRYVVFDAAGNNNLVRPPASLATNLFVRDLQTDVTTLLTPASPELDWKRVSVGRFVIAPDSRTVAFEAHVTTLSGKPAYSGIFVRSLSNLLGLPDSIRFDRPTLALRRGAAGRAMALEWDAILGRGYRVQFKDRLEDPVWRDLPESELMGGTPGALPVSPAAVRQRFFRVVENQP